MTTNRGGDFKFTVPEQHIYLGFKADANLLQYFKEQFKTSNNVNNKEVIDGIESFLENCQNRVNWCIIVSDDPINIEPYIQTDFLDEEDMDIE